MPKRWRPTLNSCKCELVQPIVSCSVQCSSPRVMSLRTSTRRQMGGLMSDSVTLIRKSVAPTACELAKLQPNGKRATGARGKAAFRS